MAKSIFRAANTMNSIVIDDYNYEQNVQANRLAGYAHNNNGV